MQGHGAAAEGEAALQRDVVAGLKLERAAGGRGDSAGRSDGQVLHAAECAAERDARTGTQTVVDGGDGACGDVAERNLAALALALAGSVTQFDRYRATTGVDACASRHRDCCRSGVTELIDDAVREPVVGDESQAAVSGGNAGVQEDAAAGLQGQVAAG